MLITSVDNKKIKNYLKLRESSIRKEEKMFLIEGMHLVKEAYNNHLLIDILLLENENLEFDYDGEITYVSENVIKKFSTLKSFSKVVGICKVLNNNDVVGNKILLLDNIQDPGNLGTIIRSSLAFNINTIVLSDDSVDLYNEKVVRSTQGMLFNINIVRDNIYNVIMKLKQEDYLILGTDVDNGTNVCSIRSKKYALIVGNEGLGVKKNILDLCDKTLYIDMNNNCESLNVGVATSILIYELNKVPYE